MLLLVYHKHTQWAGPGRTNANVVGFPLLPVYAAKAGGFFFIVFGVTALMGALLQINPIWMYGPYDPSKVTAGSQPDWYMGWLEGGLRIMPPWETEIWGFTISWNVMVPGLLLMGLLFMVLGAYPFVEAWITGDKREHHLLDRPRNVPTRTGLGVAGITAYGLLWVAGGNDIIAVQFDVSLNAVTWFMRFAMFIGPVIAFIIARRWAISLQRHDRELLLHGYETGVIVRSPKGEYTEIHAPISTRPGLHAHRPRAAQRPWSCLPARTRTASQRPSRASTGCGPAVAVLVRRRHPEADGRGARGSRSPRPRRRPRHRQQRWHHGIETTGSRHRRRLRPRQEEASQPALSRFHPRPQDEPQSPPMKGRF